MYYKNDNDEEIYKITSGKYDFVQIYISGDHVNNKSINCAVIQKLR